MAWKRSLSISSTLINRRLHPSSSHILHNNTDDTKSHYHTTSPFRPAVSNILPQGLHNGTTTFGPLSRGRTCLDFFLPMGLGSSFCRHMSSTNGEGSDKIDGISYVSEAITDKTVEAVASQAPVLSEVAVAAADSLYPVAALQYLIDGIHSYCGLHWWASIALATLLIRGATLPLLINHVRDASKLRLMRPRFEELKQVLEDEELDDDAESKHREKVKALFQEYGVTPLSPLKRVFVHAPIFIGFFLAIRAMTEKVPSFQSGGALWFVDLTTQDTLFILPVLTVLTFWINIESDLKGSLHNRPSGIQKKLLRISAIIAIPYLAAWPTAFFCYWLTSNIFSLAFFSAIKLPKVKRFLDLPEAAPTMSSASKQNVEDEEAKRN